MGTADILILIFCLVGVVLLFAWLYWILRKDYLLTKQVFTSIKKNKFVFSILIIFVSLTISITTGSYLAGSRTTNSINDLMTDSSTPLGVTPLRELGVNTARIEYFHIRHEEGSTNPIESDCNQSIGGDEVCDLSFMGTSNGTEISEYWWYQSENSYSIPVPSFEEWIESSEILPYHEELFYLDSLNPYSGENRIAMLFYTLNMFNTYGINIQGNQILKPGELGINTRMEMIDDYYIYFDGNESVFYDANVVMIPSVNNVTNIPAISSLTGNEYIVNNIILNDFNNSIFDDNGDYALDKNEVIIFSNFAESNNIKVGDTLNLVGEFYDINEKSIELEIVGMGYVSSDINRQNSGGEENDWNSKTTVFISEELFYSKDFAYRLLENPEEGFKSLNGGEDNNEGVKDSSVIYEINIGYAPIYDDFNNEIIFPLAELSKTNSDSEESIYSLFSNEIESYLIPFFYTFSSGVPFVFSDYPIAISDVDIDVSGTTIIYEITDASYYAPNKGYAQISSQIELQTIFTNELLLIFLIINSVVLMIFILKRVKENISELFTLKSLGYRNSSISLTYALYPVIIMTIGGIIGMILSLFIQQFWIVFAGGMMAASYGVPFVTPTIFAVNIFIPLIAISLLVFALLYFYLRKSTVKGIAGEIEHKPNFLVRWWTDVTNSKFSFISTYRVKNIFRQFGKSSFIFFAVIGTTMLTAFSISLANWENYAINLTSDIYGGASAAKWYPTNTSVNGNDELPEAYYSEKELDSAIESGLLSEYTFGDSDENYENLVDALTMTGPLTDPTEILDLQTEWVSTVGQYMMTTPISDTFIYSNLYSNDTASLGNGLSEFFENLLQVNSSCLVSVFAGWIISPQGFFSALLNDAALWATIDDSTLIEDCTTNQDKELLHQAGLDLYLGFADFISNDNGLLGMHTAALYTNVVNALLSPDDKVILIGNGSSVDISMVSEAMSQMLVFGLFSTISLESLFEAVSLIPSEGVGPALSHLEKANRQTYITPNKGSYNEGRDFNAIFELSMYEGNFQTSSIQTVFTYDESIEEMVDIIIEEGDGDDLFEMGRQYSSTNNKGSSSGEPLYIPAFTTSASQALGQDRYGHQGIATYNPSLLNWDNEKCYGLEYGCNPGDPNYNSSHTWVAIPTGNGPTYEGHLVIENNSRYNTKFIRDENGIWEIPVWYVSYNETGNIIELENPEQSGLDPYISYNYESAALFSVNLDYIGVFQIPVNSGILVYRGDDGLGDFMDENKYNVIGKVPDKDGNFELAEKYQPFWSEALNKFSEENQYLIIGDNTDENSQPINTFGSPTPIPFPLSILYDSVESIYSPFTNLTSFFTISSYILIAILLFLVTYETLNANKKEISTLKALGYKSSTTNGLIIDGQGIVMLTGFFAMIAFVPMFLRGVSSALSASTTLLFDLGAQLGILWISFGALLIIFSIIYLGGYFLTKYISPLFSMRGI